MDVHGPVEASTKKYGIGMTYAAAVINFHQMGIEMKVPRAEHPDAATEEERAEYQRRTRKDILRLAPEGFLPMFQDEVHVQSYKNAHRTVGLRGVHAVAPSSTERARLTLSGIVGDGFCYAMDMPMSNGEGFIWFCLRLHELFGKVRLVLDHASYHLSRMVKKFIARCRHWLRVHLTPKYTPNDNSAEPQWLAL